MSSPLNNPLVAEWFRRFDAATRHLPAEERASQREEVQQHLEGLVAANTALDQPSEAAWKAALTQFGDPTQIGRKIYQEWQQSRTGFRADMRAILFGIGLLVLRKYVVQILSVLWFNRLHTPSDRLHTHGQGVAGAALVVDVILLSGATVLINVVIGRKYSFQAMKGAFYSGVLCSLWVWMSFAVVSVQHHSPLQSVLIIIADFMLLLPLGLVTNLTIAYLASMTKRGWYRPSLADFKLTMPRKLLHLGR